MKKINYIFMIFIVMGFVVQPISGSFQTSEHTEESPLIHISLDFSQLAKVPAISKIGATASPSGLTSEEVYTREYTYKVLDGYCCTPSKPIYAGKYTIKLKVWRIDYAPNYWVFVVELQHQIRPGFDLDTGPNDEWDPYYQTHKIWDRFDIDYYHSSDHQLDDYGPEGTIGMSTQSVSFNLAATATFGNDIVPGVRGSVGFSSSYSKPDVEIRDHSDFDDSVEKAEWTHIFGWAKDIARFTYTAKPAFIAVVSKSDNAQMYIREFRIWVPVNEFKIKFDWSTTFVKEVYPWYYKYKTGTGGIYIKVVN